MINMVLINSVDRLHITWIYPKEACIGKIEKKQVLNTEEHSFFFSEKDKDAAITF